jgi:hypothetical protein
MNSASLCSLAGRYDNPIPPQFLAPQDFLKIPAQTTLASGIGSLESIPRLYNMKNEDEDDFFGIEAKKNKYIRTSTIEGTKKNEFIRS